ncbi:MAG: chorismate mutase [Actinomycetota bacterium]|jgi:chorismate mutase
MRLIGIRGATMLQKNDAIEMKSAVIELLQEMLGKNKVQNDDLVSIIFTTTEDLNCAFPAASARELGLGDVPLLCSKEIEVPGAPKSVIRILIHTYSELSRKNVSHIYLRGAEILRQDLAQ